MLRMRLEYDALNHVFKLIDRDFGSILEDGALYEVKIPLMIEAFEGEDDLAVNITTLAHA